MVISDDWRFSQAFLYQCDGYCEKCNEECEEREKTNEMVRRIDTKD